ncbi:hypothetical protein CK203_092702 [Vitis vinifera]|uniref:Uncharacterized protein n=1 Tax=Vitis vinifera TaxID=29760 RepID=A0A438D861_VITVI|nr:hypothetical protein CK203_092702 [Vitis vinifera]
MAPSLSLRHQTSRLSLRHQAWLTTHVRNLEDLTGLICPFERSNRLGLSIPSSIVSQLGLSNPFYIVEEENFSLLVLDGAYLDPDGVIPYNHVPPPKCSGGALPLPVPRRRIRSPGRPPLPESHLHPHPLLPQQSLLPRLHPPSPSPQISHLYLLDFAGPPDFLPQVSPNVPQVTVLDHHKTALQLLQSWNPSNALKVIDVGRSGATIAFDYFKQRAVEEGLLEVAGEFERVRRVFEYVEDGDLWRWGLENSKAFSSGLNDMNLEFDVGLNPSLFDQVNFKRFGLQFEHGIGCFVVIWLDIQYCLIT